MLDGVGDRRAVNLVRLALVGHHLAVEQAPDEAQRFFHAVDPSPGRFVRDAELPVVTDPPAGPEPELQAPARERVHGRRLSGQHQRMAKVIGEDVRADAQPRRDRRGGRHGRDR